MPVDFQQHISDAKRRYPRSLQDATLWQDLAFLIIHSRRHGIDSGQAAHLRALCAAHEEEICRELSDRWLISIADTLAESSTGLEDDGEWRAAALVLSTMRLMEKMAHPRPGSAGQGLAISATGADVHLHFADRFAAVSTPFLQRALATCVKRWSKQPKSLWARWCAAYQKKNPARAFIDRLIHRKKS